MRATYPLALTILGLCLFTAAPSAAAIPEAALPARGGVLSPEERVRAHTALERVYYNHRLWPKENPGPKPPFEEMVPAALIEKKALEPLRMSAALKQIWNIEITPAMLQNELDRMERESKDRATLHELFAALRNDPYLIAETLARSNFSEKALRHHYAYDVNLHAESRRRAEEIAEKIKAGAEWSGLDASYSHRRILLEDDAPAERLRAAAPEKTDELRLSSEDFAVLHMRLTSRETNSFREEEAGFLFERKISEKSNSLEMETLFIPKRPYDEWWAQATLQPMNEVMPASIQRDVFRLPAPGLVTAGGCDAWSGTAGQQLAARESHTAVWTGSEMIVWGGTPDGGITLLNTGSRYSPATDTWITSSVGANVPVARLYHTAVWTGTEMIVWGGSSGAAYLKTGGRYNPATDAWTATNSSFSAPTARYKHTAVWSGSEMIIWGGYDDFTFFVVGGRYNPTTNSWIATSGGTNVPAARINHTAVWTGSEMIVWGGFTAPGTYFNTGGRYNPSTNSWTATSIGANVPAGRDEHTAVWTGSEMIVWGGYSSAIGFLNTGGRYNPATDNWSTTSVGANVPIARYVHAAVWTGAEMIVWGGFGGGYQNTGGRYNPATDTWIATSIGANVPAARFGHTAVWTGSEMIVWGGVRGGDLNTGGRYNPATDNWLTTSISANVPMARRDNSAVWTGTEMIIWGGYDGTAYLNTGGRYNPSTDTWVATSTGANVPTGRRYHSAVWMGTEMIVWGGFGGAYQKDGGRYNPSTDTWIGVSGVIANVPSVRYGHTAVWTGSEMIIWGGYDGSAYLNSGARFNPGTTTWATTSVGTNRPSGRYLHSAVWTGTEMIVWGGYEGGVFYDNTGGRYNPGTDTWLTTSVGTNVPSVRYSHTAVWTGSEMVVWGGAIPASPFSTNTGGRYTPGTNSWVTTSAGANVPTVRASHIAVWTGSAMIVWGGFGGSYLNNGGRYNAAADSWLATSTGANVPSVRYSHTAVWTGSGMVVWGGYNGAYLNTGGIYTLDVPGPVGTSLRGGKSATVDLSWTAASGATSYNVKRCVASCTPAAIVATPATNSYSEAMNATSYFYAVEAVNACGATP